MIARADLHTHSTASDGQYPPERLVELAKDRGIEVLALTDHDTLDGLEAAERVGADLGIRIVRGVELSAREYHTFHILGYAFRRGDTPLERLCRRMRSNREERIYRILAYLEDLGFRLSEEEVRICAGGGVVGRPHFARAMVERGYAANTREVFDRWLDTDAYHDRVERGKPPVRECLDAIHASGGKVSLAHPYQIGLEDTALDALVGQLTDWGLDAMECYYPRHTEAMTAFFLRTAEKYHLHVTGGSDFHGERVKPDIALTPWDLELDWLEGGNARE